MISNAENFFHLSVAYLFLSPFEKCWYTSMARFRSGSFDFLAESLDMDRVTCRLCRIFTLSHRAFLPVLMIVTFTVQKLFSFPQCHVSAFALFFMLLEFIQEQNKTKQLKTCSTSMLWNIFPGWAISPGPVYLLKNQFWVSFIFCIDVCFI